MKNIIITGFGSALILLGIMTFVFDFMTAKKVIDIASEDPYPLQWASVVGAMFCAMGFGMIFRVAEQHSEGLRNTREVSAKSYHTNISWWASFKHNLSHDLENLGHVLRILH